MRAVIIDYGSGNLRSVAKSFERIANAEDLITVSSDPKALADATHIILPGVGAFGDCMQGLTGIAGMREALEKNVQEAKKPFLGICVGMQLLATAGYEYGEHPGLGWINGKVERIQPEGNTQHKIPHMGWNDLIVEQPHPVTETIATGSHAYFVHSYHFIPEDKATILATVEYGKPIVAIIAKDNMIATQFHPEKSQDTGLTLLANFSKWRP